MNGAALPRTSFGAWSVGIGLASVLALYAPLVPALAGEWAKFPSLSHGFAIPIIGAYLIWGRRQHIAAEPLGSSPLGLPVVVLGLMMLVIGSLGGESFVARLSLPLLLLGTVLFLAGPGVTRHVWMGFAYLFFMVPLSFTVLKPLTYRSQLFDATVAAQVLPWLGVPVLQDGIFLRLANMTLEVAPDCSSIPAIAALAALGAAYGQLRPRPASVRVVLTLAAVPLGLASNLARIVPHRMERLPVWSGRPGQRRSQVQRNDRVPRHGRVADRPGRPPASCRVRATTVAWAPAGG